MTGPLPPLLMLHGWGGSVAETFASDGWCDDFRAAGRTLITRDLPGHGAGASANPKAYADLAGDILKVMPAERQDVIAYSLGAKLALAIAAADRARFGKMVLVGVGDNIFAPEPDGEAMAGYLTGERTGDPPPPIAALIHYARQNGNDPAAMAALLRRPPNPVVDPDSVPDGEDILIVNSDADRIAMPDQRLRAMMPRARHISIPDVPHLSLPRNAQFRSEAARFLNL